MNWKRFLAPTAGEISIAVSRPADRSQSGDPAQFLPAAGDLCRENKL